MRNKLNQVIDEIELTNDVIRITSVPFAEYSIAFWTVAVADGCPIVEN